MKISGLLTVALFLGVSLVMRVDMLGFIMGFITAFMYWVVASSD